MTAAAATESSIGSEFVARLADRAADAEIYPALAPLPASEIRVEDVWLTDGMRATGSDDVVITDAFVPEHRLARVTDIYAGTAPGAAGTWSPRAIPCHVECGARRGWRRRTSSASRSR
jgi:alkylation response protein AidB-like acyl-CoA dehydrogenase